MSMKVQQSRAPREPASEGVTARRPVPRKVRGVLRAAGMPLPRDVRTEMEPRFRQDFSGVRVHADGDAAEAASLVSARAFTVGSHIVFGRGEYRPNSSDGNRLLAHELTHVVQQRDGWFDGHLGVTEPSDAVEHEATRNEFLAGPSHARVARYAHPFAVARQEKGKKSKLLDAFRAKFGDAAKKIDASPSALKLVAEAEAAGAEFGGYAEDGPHKDTWPYTAGKAVYVPKGRTDPVLAMSDFLFELNNAVRAPQFQSLANEAAKGSKGTLTAKTFAYKTVELEVEGMLRLGEIWFEMKKSAPKDTPAKYDSEFYQAEYIAFKDKKKPKDDIIKDILQRKYTVGVDKGKTTEQYYMEQYEKQSGGK
jgi:Domain of unknown function (DUF4157)